MKSTRKTQVVFPTGLLEEVDRVVGGRKRSEFVVEATRQRLALLKFRAALAATAGAWRAADHPETGSQADLTRWLRQSRDATRRRLRARRGG